MPDATDPAAAALAEIRERWSKVKYVGLKPEVVPEPGYQPPWLPDVDHLLAAVEAVLKGHGDEPPAPGWYDAGRYCPACTRLATERAGKHVFVSPSDCIVRPAITRELTGEGG